MWREKGKCKITEAVNKKGRYGRFENEREIGKYESNGRSERQKDKIRENMKENWR